jgi:hypothetical protein
MKISKSFIVAAAILAAATLFVWNRIERTKNSATTTDEGARAWMLTHHEAVTNQVVTNSPAPQPSPSSNRVPHDLGFRQKATELSDAERLEMTNLFVTELKPAVEKWASVYGEHIPFNVADLAMDKFVERIGRDSKIYHSYTFVTGDITLGIVQQSGNTQVQYLASKNGLTVMQTMPTAGAMPDLSTPVTVSQVLALADADSGQQIPANLVRLIPSAESGSLAGGVIADVGSAIKNAAGIPISKADPGFMYVFAKDGKLAYYQRTR